MNGSINPITPEKIRWLSGVDRPADLALTLNVDKQTGQLSAILSAAGTNWTIPRERIQGIAQEWKAQEISRFVSHAVCECQRTVEESFSIRFYDGKQKFIEELTAQKIREFETSHSSLDETIKAHKGPQFIYEFTQNAHDAKVEEGNKEIDVTFTLHDATLIISHNGRHFDEEDIKTISSSHRKDSAKRQDKECIGYKGIGFKSIFNHSSSVAVLSGGYSFRFDQEAEEWKGKGDFPWELCPLYTPPQAAIDKFGLNPQRVNFIIQLNVPKNKAKGHLEEFFKQNAHELFFFLPRLKQLRFAKGLGAAEETVTFEKRACESPALAPALAPQEASDTKVENETFELFRNGLSVGTWLSYKRTVILPEKVRQDLRQDPRIPARYKDMPDTPLSFAIPLHVDRKEKTNLFCYLPTGVSIDTPLAINAHFFLELNRKLLEEDNFFNEHLFRCLGKALFHFYAFVAKHFPNKLFAILVNVETLRFDTNPEKYKRFFLETAKKAIQDIPFLPARGNQLLKPKEATIDEWLFARQFCPELAGRLLIDCQAQYYPLLESLEVNRFSWEQIEATLKRKDFVQSVVDNPQKGLELLRFFKSLFDRNMQRDKIKALPFLLSKATRRLCAPKDIYTPAQDRLEGLEFVAIDVLPDDVLNALQDVEKKWLKEDLAVSTASHLTYVTAINKMKSVKAIAKTLPVLCRMFAESRQVPHDFTFLQLPVVGETDEGERKVFTPVSCYLPDDLDPHHRLQGALAPDYENYLFPSIYAQVSPGDRPNLRGCLLEMGVSGRLSEHNVQGFVKSLEGSKKRQMQFVQFIFRQLFLIPEEEEEFKKIAAVMRRLPILWTKRSQAKKPEECFLPSEFAPQMDLFTASPDIPRHLSFVSEQYVEVASDYGNWKKFFLELGVRESLRVEIQKTSMSAESFNNKLEEEIKLSSFRASSMKRSSYDYVEFLWERKDYPPSAACIRSHSTPFTTLACADTKRPSYMHQHSLSPIIWIEYAFLIKGTKLFWEIIRNNWEEIKHILEEPVFYKTWCSSRERALPSMLEFYTHDAVVLDMGRFSPHEIYSPRLRWLVKGILPVPDEGFPLNDDQLNEFKFKVLISLPDCLSLLMALPNSPDDSENESKAAEIYRHLLQNPLQGVAISPDLPLLTETGGFREASALLGNCIEGVSFKNEANRFLKRPAGISMEDFNRLCQVFHVTTLQRESLHIEAPNATSDDDFKRKVLGRLPLAFTKRIGPSTSDESVLDELERCARQLASLQFAVSPSVTVSMNGFSFSLREPVFAWRHGDILFGKESFVHPSTLAETAHQLHEFLQLPCRTEEFAHWLSSDDKQIFDYYDYKGEKELYERSRLLAAQVEERLKENVDAMDVDEPPKDSTPPPQPSSALPAPDPASQAEQFSEEIDLPASPEKQKTSIEAIPPSTPVAVSMPLPTPGSPMLSPIPPARTSSAVKRKADAPPVDAPLPPQKKVAIADNNAYKPRAVAAVNYPRKAEAALFDYFKTKYQSDGRDGEAVKIYPTGSEKGDCKVVRWINYETERYASYDFRADTFRGDEIVKTKYLEVKSKDPNSPSVEHVTLPEDEHGLMQATRENYSLWIAKFHDDRTPPELFKLKHPALKIEAGSVAVLEIPRPTYRLTIPKTELEKKH